MTLVATDSSGLTGSRAVRLEPRAASVRVRTDAPSTRVSVDGVEGEDVRRTVIAGTRVTIAASGAQYVDGELWRFGGWSDGAFGPTRELTPSGDVSLTAHFHGPPKSTPAPTAIPTAAPEPAAPTSPSLPALRITVGPRGVARRLAPRVPVLVRCSRACSVTATAVLIAGRAERRLPPPAIVRRAAGDRLLVRLPAGARRAARHALRRDRSARVGLRIAARAAGGRPVRRTVTLALRLP